VIESLGADWDAERYTDCYRERLKRVVKQKQKGERVKAPSEPKQPKSAPDLMEALEATLERMGPAKGKGDGKGSRKSGRRKAAAKN
jgi:non-homologous end joining protein Ku